MTQIWDILIIAEILLDGADLEYPKSLCNTLSVTNTANRKIFSCQIHSYICPFGGRYRIHLMKISLRVSVK